MNKIDLLKTRRAKLLEAGKNVREKIAALTDECSFVELDAYSFSHNDFYGEDAEGEGVVTGYATINDEPGLHSRSESGRFIRRNQRGQLQKNQKVPQQGSCGSETRRLPFRFARRSSRRRGKRT